MCSRRWNENFKANIRRRTSWFISDSYNTDSIIHSPVKPHVRCMNPLCSGLSIMPHRSLLIDETHNISILWCKYGRWRVHPRTLASPGNCILAWYHGIYTSRNNWTIYLHIITLSHSTYSSAKIELYNQLLS